jgi:hypothetical protein
MAAMGSPAGGAESAFTGVSRGRMRALPSGASNASQLPMAAMSTDEHALARQF